MRNLWLSFIIIFYLAPLFAKNATLPKLRGPANRRFWGVSVWRFKSDKPRARKIAAAKNHDFADPLYLYNRSSLFYQPSLDKMAALRFVFLRRNETSNGVSEPPVNTHTLKQGLAWRHLTLSWENRNLRIYAGDFLMGWGQGLALAQNPGSPYRSFFIKNHQAQIKPNRSSYENNGLRGLALAQKSGPWRLLTAMTLTPLHGRLGQNNAFLEDLNNLDKRFVGEWGGPAALSRRNTLKERGFILRMERQFDKSLAGFSAAYFNFNRDFNPPVLDKAPAPANNHHLRWRGRSYGLINVDAAAVLTEEQSIFLDGSLSLSGFKAAAAGVLAWSLRRQKQKLETGFFYLNPYYLSRLADGPRWGEAQRANRLGFFSAYGRRAGIHDAGAQIQIEKNIEAQFSGHALSHAPPESRWLRRARADDEIRLSESLSLYLRGEWAAMPYLIHAMTQPETTMLRQQSYRWQNSRSWRQGKAMLGLDWAQMTARGHPGKKTQGKNAYAQLRLHAQHDFLVELKIERFDIGPALFGNRNLYLSRPEAYWRNLYLSSIAYESLFASYAGKGRRWMVAVEQKALEGLSLWLKLGSTQLKNSGSDGAQNAGRPGKTFVQTRWDFKTELSFAW